MIEQGDTKTDELALRLQRLEDRERRRRRQRARWLLGAASLGALSVPFGAFGLGPVPNIFADGEVISAAAMNENFAYLQNAITAVEMQVPTGTVAFFDLDACPTGWSEYTAAHGRTLVGTPAGGTHGTNVGDPLTDGGSRTISEVPAHGHALSGNGTLDTSSTGSHTHPANAGSAGGHTHSASSGTAGLHTHTLNLEVASAYGISYVMGTVNSAGGNFSSAAVSNAGNHNHPITVNAVGNHSHSVSMGNAGTHLHTVDLSGLSVSSTGSAMVDVTMPYTQLLACRRD